MLWCTMIDDFIEFLTYRLTSCGFKVLRKHDSIGNALFVCNGDIIILVILFNDCSTDYFDYYFKYGYEDDVFSYCSISDFNIDVFISTFMNFIDKDTVVC